MKQFFVPEKYKRIGPASTYIIKYISKVNVDDFNHPRTLHAHEDLVELILITEGNGEVFIGDCYFPVEKGDLIVYNSKIVHDELFSSEPVSLYCLGIKGINEAHLRPNALISDAIQPIFKTGNVYSLLLSMLEAAFDMLEKKVMGYEELVQMLGDTILFFIKKNILNGYVRNIEELDKLEIVREIKQYLDNNFSEEFKLKDFKKNREWPINEFYFAHKFKGLYGYSPIEYLQRRRIGEAQTLLINTRLTVTDIAHQVGFNSSAYFATLFKKIVKVSPKDYRSQYTKR